MRRRVGVMLVAVVWLAAFAVPANAVEPERPAPTTAGEVAPSDPQPLPRQGTDKLARDSWIVMLERGANPRAAAPGLAKKAGGSVGQVYSHAIKGFQFKGSAKAAAALRKNPNVLSVTPDHAVYVAETDPFGIERIDAFIVGGGDAYSAGYRGAGARIAVIDTGIDLDHPDLAESIDTDAGLNCFNDEVPPNDGHGHGTHVAGTAAAPLNDIGVVGVAPEATLVPIKVFDDAGNSSEALVLCGVDRIVALNTRRHPSQRHRCRQHELGRPAAVGLVRRRPTPCVDLCGRRPRDRARRWGRKQRVQRGDVRAGRLPRGHQRLRDRRLRRGSGRPRRLPVHPDPAGEPVR